MQLSATTVFKAVDFKSIRLEIRFENSTSHTKIDDSTQLELLEILEKAIVLALPPKSCNLEHNVLIEIAASVPNGKDFTFKSTGKVTELEKLDDNSLRARIALLQFNDNSWRSLNELYSARQEAITSFLMMAKG